MQNNHKHTLKKKDLEIFRDELKCDPSENSQFDICYLYPVVVTGASQLFVEWGKKKKGGRVVTDLRYNKIWIKYMTITVKHLN